MDAHAHNNEVSTEFIMRLHPILPIEYRKYDFREVITKGDYFIHYCVYGKHTEERINEFWDGWRKVLNKYK